MSEETQKVRVKRKTIDGVQYFIDGNNILYDTKTKEEKGLWDEESKTIQPLPDEEEDEDDDEEDDDEEDDDEDYPDETDGFYYLSKSPSYFNKTKEILKEDGRTISHHIATFDTGIRLQRSYMTEDIVKLDAFLAFGVPVIVETNGLVRIFGRDDKKSFVVDFVTKDGSIRKRGIDNSKSDIIGIYNPSKRAFVALFGYGKRHTTLETYDETIANAFRDYILPKVLFTPLGTLYKYKPKPLKLPPLEKALEDAKKDLDAETDPVKQKVIRSLMKKIISSIPKAKEYDDAEIAKREMYNAKDELTKQRNIEIVAEQKRIKKEIKDKEDEEERLRLEALNKEREEQKAKAAEEKRKLDARNAYNALPKQVKKDMEFLDDTKNKLKKLTFYDDMVREGMTIRRVPTPVSSMSVTNYIKLQDLLTELNKRPDMSFPAGYNEYGGRYEGVDSSTLRANIEEALARYKMSFIVNIYEELKEPRNMVKQPERWIDFDETTKKGLKKKTEFIAEAEKRIKEYSDLLEKNASKEERDQAIDIVNQRIREENEKKRKKQEEKKGTGIDNPELYEKAKIIADNLYDKPSAYKSGFIVKTYKELGGTYSGEKPNKSGIARWFKEEWKDIGDAEYPVYRPTKRITKDTPLTPEEIQPSNLRSQIALKQKIKGTENLPPFVGKGIEQYSNPKIVFKKAKEYLGKDVEIEISNKKDKKYMVKTPDGRWVHFGQLGYEDFTKHKDEQRRKNYLTRTANMKGDWKYDKYSPNNLSRNILW